MQDFGSGGVSSLQSSSAKGQAKRKWKARVVILSHLDLKEDRERNAE